MLSHDGEAVETDGARRGALDFGKALGVRDALGGDRQLGSMRPVEALAHCVFVASQSECEVLLPATSARNLARERAKQASF